jgi:hypothetical protein
MNDKKEGVDGYITSKRTDAFSQVSEKERRLSARALRKK